MSVRSMTGFARARRSGDFGEVVVTLRSVNHRTLDVHSHLPGGLEALEPELRSMAKQQVVRGHVDVRVAMSPARIAAGCGLNRPLFEAYLSALEDAKTSFGIEALADLNSALRIPGMLAVTEPEDGADKLKAAVMEAAQEAFQMLNEFRMREGQEIADSMMTQCRIVASIKEEIEKLRDGLAPLLQTRLRERLNELLAAGGNSSAVDPQRLTQEIAVLADRSDIHEEIARLGVHAGEVTALLSSDGEAGKKLDFLLQEMNRETNTILSKTNGLGEDGLRITDLGIRAKSAIEKIREQASNLE